MDTEYEKSRVERAKRGLYRADSAKGDVAQDIPHLSPVDVDVQKNWDDTEIVFPTKKIQTHHITAKFIKFFVILAALAATSSGGYVLYQMFDPEVRASEKNIIVTIEAPVAVAPGTLADVVVHVANHNRIGLDYANLSVVFPSGTRSSEDSDKDFRDQKKLLGTISPGESVELRTKVIFLGEENEEKNIRALIDYRFEGMNSSFTKESVRPVRLNSAPVNMTVDVVKEASAGQTIDLAINARSNTTIPLRDVLIKVEYPTGFTFKYADPKPTFGNNIWRVGTVDPAGKFPIRINGILDGADTEKRVFKTTLGVGADKTDREIATPYSHAVSEITVARPFIGTTLMVNGEYAEDATARFGGEVNGIITWKNNLPTRISNAEIEVRLSGVALDRSSVTVGGGGFFRSVDNTITWDERGAPDLALIEAGGDGSVEFKFKPLPSQTGNRLMTNPTMTVEVTVRGKRLSDANVPEELKTVRVQNVRVASEVQFATRSLFYAGPFINSGPMPPRVEQETTFTVVWSIVNSSNSITNTRVRAVLPPYVKWYGSVSPSKENITFDKYTKEIIWNPGEVPAGTGINLPPKEVAFQLVVFPSLTQKGLVLPILNDQVFSAIDTFTNSEFKLNAKDVGTDIPTDPTAAWGIGKVAE